ncbi:MAG: FG-GAP-like repeat-containing protein [Cytophagales bacterium]|nr:FG-GAP-like repeat-containing protein [Cytophagales bacterium]
MINRFTGKLFFIFILTFISYIYSYAQTVTITNSGTALVFNDAQDSITLSGFSLSAGQGLQLTKIAGPSSVTTVTTTNLKVLLNQSYFVIQRFGTPFGYSLLYNYSNNTSINGTAYEHASKLATRPIAGSTWSEMTNTTNTLLNQYQAFGLSSDMEITVGYKEFIGNLSFSGLNAPTGTNIQVSYEAGLMNAGNIMSLELSDNAGNFPGTILTTITSSVSGIINAVIPTSACGSNYKMVINSSNPSAVSPISPSAFGTESITITSPITIIQQPVAGVTVCGGAAAIFNVSATGNVALYQWYQNGNPVGTNTAQITLSGNNTTVVSNVYCFLSNSCNSLNSYYSVLTPKNLTFVNTITSFAIAPTQTTKLSLTVAGDAVASYQWVRNGVALANDATFSGVNLPSLSINNASLALHNSVFRLIATSSCQAVTSSGAVLSVISGFPIINSFSNLTSSFVAPNLAYGGCFGAPADDIEIVGNNFNPAATNVSVNGIKVNTSSISATNITFTMPEYTTGGSNLSGFITVSTPGGSMSYFTTPVKAYNCPSGSGNFNIGRGATLRITGGDMYNVDVVSFDGVGALPFTVASDQKSIIVHIPAATPLLTGLIKLIEDNAVYDLNASPFSIVDAPTISSVTQNTNLPGANAVINGSNFAVPSTVNVVFFGNNKSIPFNGGSGSSFTVSVPSGFVNDEIMVFNSNTGLYSKAFTWLKQTPVYATPVKTASGSYFTETNPPFSTQSQGLAVADFNIDGKNDMAIGVPSELALKVFRNTHTATTVGTSFVLDYNNNTLIDGLYQLQTADFDTDGKIDIVGIVNNDGNNNSVFYYYRNVSTIGGAIDFEISSPNIYSPTESFTFNRILSANDFDLDGKPDLAFLVKPNPFTEEIHIARNISNSGLLDATSFTNPIFIWQMPQPYTNITSIESKDLNNDGKPDLIIGEENSGQTRYLVLRNQSSKGIINTSSFAPPITVHTEQGTSYWPTYGDLDGDGLADMAVASFNNNSIKVLKNTSFGATITFSSNIITYSAGTLPAHGAILPVIAPVSEASPNPEILYMYSDGSSSFNIGILNNVSTSVGIDQNTFAPATAMTITGSIGSNLNEFMVYDMNNDFQPEIIYTLNDGIYIFENNNCLIYPHTITSIPTNKTVNESAGVINLNASAFSTVGNTYQWQKSNDNIIFSNIINGGAYSGANTLNLSITNPDLSLSGTYFRLIVSSACTPVTVTSLGAISVVGVCPAINIIQNPVTNAPVCPIVGTAIFNGSITGRNIVYQWQEFAGTWQNVTTLGGIYSGINTPSLTVTSMPASFNGRNLRLIGTDLCSLSGATNGLAAIQLGNTLSGVGTAFSVGSSTTCGANILFSTSATGLGLTYQWQEFNGSSWTNVINNATYTGSNTSTLTIISPNFGLNNFQYRAIINDACGASGTTAGTTLTRVIPPNINFSPQSPVMNENAGVVTITSTVTGTYSSVHWQTFSGTWVNITPSPTFPEVTTTSLIISAPGISLDQSIYRLFVTAAICGNFSSGTIATLSVSGCGTPNIISEPLSANVCTNTNSTALFGVVASGVGQSAQWQEFNGSWANITNTGIYSGANTFGLTISGLLTTLAGRNYRAIITDACNNVLTTNGLASISSNTSLSGINTPLPVSSSTVCSGVNGSFYVTSSGVSLAFAWQESPDGILWTTLINNATYTGVNTNTLLINTLNPILSSYHYRSIMTDGCGYGITTNGVNLYIESSPTFSFAPQSVTLNENTGSTTFTGTVSGSFTNINWQYFDGIIWNNLVQNAIYQNVTSTSLIITAPPISENNYQYRISVNTPFCGNVNSTTIGTLSVSGCGTPSIINEPAAVNICANAATPILFSVNASGVGLNYQWQQNSSTWQNITNTGVYAGSNTASLTISGGAGTLVGSSFRVIITDGCSNTLTTNGLAAINVISTMTGFTDLSFISNNTICGGNAAIISSTATGTGLNYQWQLFDGLGWVNVTNNATFLGVNNNVLTINTNFSLNNTQYRVTITDACAYNVTSNGVNLLVTNPLSGSISTTNNTVEEGTGTIIITSTIVGNPASYQWQEFNTNWNNLTDTPPYSGVNTSLLTISSPNFSLNGRLYRLVASDTYCGNIILPNTVTINVTASPNCNPPTLSLQPVNISGICELAGNHTFTGNATGANVVYLWQQKIGSVWTDMNTTSQFVNVSTPSLVVVAPPYSISGILFRLKVSFSTCSNKYTYSDSVSLSVFKSIPDILTSPANILLCQNAGTGLFSASILGQGLSYQWEMQSSNVWQNIEENSTFAGVNNDTLRVINPNIELNNHKIRLRVTGTCSADIAYTDGNATLQVYGRPLLTPTISQTCDLNSSFLTSSANAVYQRYNWTYNNTQLSGETATGLNLLLPGAYTVYVNGLRQCASASYTYTPSSTVARPSITGFGTPDDTLLISSDAASYQWYVNNKLINKANAKELKTYYNGSYHAVVKYANGCISKSETYTISSAKYLDIMRAQAYITDSSITFAEDTPILIWPNPTTGTFVVNYIGNSALKVLKIYSPSAILIHSQPMEGNYANIQLSDTHKGLYYIQIIDNETIKTSKIIIY